jgi:hypothetical protein
VLTGVNSSQTNATNAANSATASATSAANAAGSANAAATSANNAANSATAAAGSATNAATSATAAAASVTSAQTQATNAANSAAAAAASAATALQNARISLFVNGEPNVTEPWEYLFAEKTVFQAGWGASVGSCQFMTGTSAVFNVYAYNVANPNGLLIAQITFTANGNTINGQASGTAAFSVMTGAFTFNPGDMMIVVPQNTNVSAAACSFRGAYQ